MPTKTRTRSNPNEKTFELDDIVLKKDTKEYISDFNETFTRQEFTDILTLYYSQNTSLANTDIAKDYLTTKDIVEMLKEEGANDQEITKILKTYHDQRKENEVININPSKKISDAATDLESKILGLQEHLKEDNFKTTARVHSDSDNLEKDLEYQITIKKNESITINVSSKEDDEQAKKEDKLYTLKIELNPGIEKPKSKVRELTDHPLHKYSI
ncbi:MAG: hypothetical protein ACMXX7_01910 [Candidatus Woesearchaeota archaeon]